MNVEKKTKRQNKTRVKKTAKKPGNTATKSVKSVNKSVKTGARSRVLIKNKNAPVKKVVLKKDKDKFVLINRDLSWLSFNARVLQEAADPNVPLMERFKFLGIFSNNLDEFFRVRVASIRRVLQLKNKAIASERTEAKKLLDKIRKEVMKQQRLFDEVYTRKLLPELASHHIYIVKETDLNRKELQHVKNYFAEQISPRLFPLILEQGKAIPELKDGEIYLAVRMQNSATAHVQFALINIPTRVIPRFYRLPETQGKTRLILLDDMIRCGLEIVFSSLDFDTFTAHTIKITRDAELDLDSEMASPLMEKVQKSLKQRKFGVPTRFLYDADIPSDLLDFLLRKLKIDADGAIPGGRYHNFRDYMRFPAVGPAELRYPALQPLHLQELDAAKSILNVAEKHDILLSYPYQSFHYIIRMLREAAIDPTVYAIKMTLYRVAENSSICDALINAVHNGKHVTVVMELRARFMEEHNIYWANRLKEEGAHVIHGVHNRKVHTKMIVISRRRNFETTHIAHIGTGNFNEETARLYGDYSLITTHEKIAAECLKVFDMIHNFKPEKFRFSTLWVSPVNTTSRFLELLQREVKHATNGKKARVIVKVNSLVDEECCIALYLAAKAGVQVDLIVRGSCSLGLEGNVPNLRIVSVIDRYLEHARVFFFENQGKPEVFLGSADLMPRNLKYRVEVTTPVLNKTLRKQLLKMLEIQLSDNVKARQLDAGLSNVYLQAEEGKQLVRSQQEIYSWLAESL
ncbi:MAG: polyphosphate kinase 1 [Bacteroidetes bacterium]|nr:polyphosphate kinase 1 [Bacteroidota bacterium]